MSILIFIAVVLLLLESIEASQEAEKNNAEIKFRLNEIKKILNNYRSYTTSGESDANFTYMIKK